MSFAKVVTQCNEELFSEEILRLFNGVTIKNDTGDSFSTNISLLAALVPSLCPLMREGLQGGQEIQVILSGYSKETLNRLDEILHCGGVLIPFSDIQQCAQLVIGLKRDLMCLGLNAPEDFWTVKKIPITCKKEFDDFSSDDSKDKTISIEEGKISNISNLRQEHEVANDVLWCKYNKVKGKPNLYCIICEKYFKEPLLLNHHLRIHHPDLNVNLMKMYDCKDCGKTLNGQIRYFRHITNEVCKLTTTLCDLCGGTFQKSILRIHKRLSHEVDKQKCDKCRKIFQNPFRLKAHDKRNHRVPIPCDFCGKLFKRNEDIKPHILNKHTADEDKEFACDLCGKRYGVKQSLEQHHLAAHSGGKKDFHCRFCEYKTWSKPNRDKHEKTVHKGAEAGQLL